jgi:hypothetical protein
VFPRTIRLAFLLRADPSFARRFDKRKGRPATWAAFSSRENSSKRRIPSETFMAKSYEPGERGVKKFL